jgi:hypothetical protein
VLQECHKSGASVLHKCPERVSRVSMVSRVSRFIRGSRVSRPSRVFRISRLSRVGRVITRTRKSPLCSMLCRVPFAEAQEPVVGMLCYAISICWGCAGLGDAAPVLL